MTEKHLAPRPETEALLLDTAYGVYGPRAEDTEGRFVLKAIVIHDGVRFEVTKHIPRDHEMHARLAADVAAWKL